ncbi:spermidine synthase [Paenibacillus nasutitermitis]|uniref:Spermidine synthase n=1 Tax=Paenibacillus nasutitermitis TaxID=1652958 RepID=A0A916YN73_9BACL|nr:fused MFS/spermidine synthase [Paenibacillus nasutitermitis]GGD53363.1 hypothetical protein GCM10010911_08670 [Paenibacillus nasutitermitis]
MHQLDKESGGFQEIVVYEAAQLFGETGKFRFLQFSDQAVQGAVDLNNPGRIVLEYPRAIIHVMECNRPSFENVFMIGHGIGTIASHYPDKRFKVAEIDGNVVELSRRYFDYRADNVEIGDGRHLLGKEEAGRLDYIIVDAFTRKGTPTHLTSLEFMKLTNEKLGSRGSLIMNLMGKPKGDRLINAIYSTLGEIYPYRTALSLRGAGEELRNIIVVGSSGAIECDSRELAGFEVIELDEGHIIWDSPHGDFLERIF